MAYETRIADDAYIDRAIHDRAVILEALVATKLPLQLAEEIAPSILIAARLESLEDAITEGLPLAGEGI